VLHFDALPKDTGELLQRLHDLEEVDGFTLIGGTALALQVGHRRSEDLDLAWTQGNLPQGQIETILKRLSAGTPPKLITDQAALLAAENDGVDLNQSHQDWQVGNVKLTFYAPFSAAQLAVYHDADAIDLGRLKVLDPEGVFKLKSSLLFERKTSRDLYDLWFFLKHGNKTVDNILDAMDDRKQHYSTDSLLDRIAPPAFGLADPGFEPLLADAPADKDSLLAAMRQVADEYRADLAYQLAIAQHHGSSKSPTR
jgi:predicted nucleotidyltransferase component of viral defense system